MRPLIIERPDLQTALQRYGYLSVTLACWLLWLYLFVPLLSLLAWALGATLLYQVLLQGLSVDDLVYLAWHYGTGIAVLCSTLVVWAVVSYLRFHDVQRRLPPETVSDDRMQQSHHLTEAEFAELRTASRLVLPAEQLARMFAEPVLPEEPTPLQAPATHNGGSRHT